MSDNKFTKAIMDEAHRLEEDCKYSSKGHFNSSSLWSLMHYTLGISAACFAAISILSPWPDFLSGYFSPQASAMLAALSASILTFVNPGQYIDAHKNSAEKLNAVKSQFRRLREIDCLAGDATDHRAILDDLCNNKDRINANAPKVLWFAYQLARLGIWMGEADHAIDKSSET